MFAVYLDIQKQLDLEDLEENEVKGRWKSFVNKWYEHIRHWNSVLFFW
jgi:DNA phosphorothioation-dependent restriction protein DptG